MLIYLTLFIYELNGLISGVKGTTRTNYPFKYGVFIIL